MLERLCCRRGDAFQDTYSYSPSQERFSVRTMVVTFPGSDPWFVPPTDQVDSWGDRMPLSPAELNYVEIIAASAPSSTLTPSSGLLDEASSDSLRETFLSDEAIIETMSLEEPPWHDSHHRSSFLPTPQDILTCLVRFSPSLPLQTPIQIDQVSSEGNMANITRTQPPDIFVKPGIVEHLHIGVTCTPEEIQLYSELFSRIS